MMVKTYFTFGSEPEFPYQDAYIVIIGKSEGDCTNAFRRAYPDRHEGCLNCAFWYNETQWSRPDLNVELKKSGPKKILVTDAVKLDVSFYTEPTKDSVEKVALLCLMANFLQEAYSEILSIEYSLTSTGAEFLTVRYVSGGYDNMRISGLSDIYLLRRVIDNLYIANGLA